MAELSLTEVFGANAVQALNALTISKADLAGLAQAPENVSDQMVVALLNLWTTAYNPGVREQNKDVSIVATLEPIPSTEGDFTDINNPVPYLVYTYSIKIYKLLPIAIPVPNDV